MVIHPPQSILYWIRYVFCIKWAWKNRYLDDLPRNLDDMKVRNNLTIHAVETIPLDDIHAIYRIAPLRLRVFILLGLNCGYTSIDIAHLSNEVIDYSEGVIDTVRSKTKQFNNRQRHRLWPITIQTIKQCQIDKIANTNGLLFVSSKGMPLVHNTVVNDTIRRTDSVFQSWRYHINKLGFKYAFKLLRKTGASIIETKLTESDSKYLTSLYLAHSERGIKRYYTDRDYTALDDTLIRLGEYFNFESIS